MLNSNLRAALLFATLIIASLDVAQAASPVTLAGSPNPATGITVDDHLDVYLNGSLIYTDGAVIGAGTRPPLSIMATTGDVLRFVVRDTFGVCSSLTPVYLINASGQGVLADPGFSTTPCTGPIGNLGVSHDFSFTIPDLDFQPKPGDIVVSAGYGVVVKVDPTSGMRTVVTDFTNPLQGALGTTPGGLAAGACGAIYATDRRSDELGKLFRIFPDGMRSLVSDAANPAQGAPWHTPFGLGLDSDGSILVTDRGIGGGGNLAGLWSVNASTGFRTRITDSGTFYGHSAPESVMLDAAGNIVMGDAEAPFSVGGGLLRVDRGTGALTVLSDFSNPAQGPLGEDAGHSIALDTDGSILVVDAYVQIGGRDGALFRVDPATGARTVLTTGLSHFSTVAVGADGSILLGDCNSPFGGGFGGGVCRVDRVTGAQTVLSDFQNPGQGPKGLPLAIAVVRPGASPLANAQSPATDEDTSLPITLTGSDPGGQALTFTIVSGPAHGSLAGAAPNLTYSPVKDYNGPDSFTFRVNNGCGNSALATVAITVRPVNDPPVAQSVAVMLDQDTSVTIVFSATDADADPLTYAVVGGPAHGALSGSGIQRTYTPAPGYSGPDSFTWKANDGTADSNVATVSITVKPAKVYDPPRAVSTFVITVEDFWANVDLGATQHNNPTPLTLTIVSGPTHGVLTGAGRLRTYTPFPNYFGPDTITWKASDGITDSNIATVSITVFPVPDPPVAVDDFFITSVGNPAIIDVMGNDFDADGDPLTVVHLSRPPNGTVTLGVDGRVTYRPKPNYVGPDSFSYAISDGHYFSNMARVAILVIRGNAPPSASKDRATTVVDTPVVIDVLANDNDPDGDPMTIVATTPAASGAVFIIGGKLTYVPAAGFIGKDQFTYTISDGHGGTSVGQVDVHVKKK